MLRVLRPAVIQAKFGGVDRLDAPRRLAVQAHNLERNASEPSFQSFVAQECAEAAVYGGRGLKLYGPSA